MIALLYRSVYQLQCQIESFWRAIKGSHRASRSRRSFAFSFKYLIQEQVYLATVNVGSRHKPTFSDAGATVGFVPIGAGGGWLGFGKPEDSFRQAK
jgi:hypothetical protein